MKAEKETKISYWAAHVTTMVSVTLVLLIVGLIALVTVSAAQETRRIREQIEISAVMTDSVSDAEAASLAEWLRAQPFALDVKVIGKQEAMDSWTNDTGVNLEELYGVNPLSPEVAFTLKADYASEPTISKVADEVRRQPGVEDVAVPDASMVADMNENIRKMSYILGGVALVMVLISFVLINNTVHLTIYSRRFTIHTMQLVGATRNFIRRPFILNNMGAGVLAGVFATALLAGTLALSPWLGITDFEAYVPWPKFAIIAAGLIAAGAMICAIASFIACTRYLGKDYDELFR